VDDSETIVEAARLDPSTDVVDIWDASGDRIAPDWLAITHYVAVDGVDSWNLYYLYDDGRVEEVEFLETLDEARHWALTTARVSPARWRSTAVPVSDGDPGTLVPWSTVQASLSQSSPGL
jgi:hypothetical protein